MFRVWVCCRKLQIYFMETGLPVMLKFVTPAVLPQVSYEGVERENHYQNAQSSLEGRRSSQRALDFATLNGSLLIPEATVQFYSCVRYKL